VCSQGVTTIKAAFLSLYGPGSWLRNAAVAMITAMLKWGEAYWLAMPEVTRTAAAACVGFYIIDTITGACVALKEGRFKSENFRDALWKFVAYASSILTAVGLDYLLTAHSFGDYYVVVTTILTIIAVNEASSIVENSGKLGFPWPGRIVEMMEKLKGNAK